MTNLPDADEASLYSPIEQLSPHVTRQIYAGRIAIITMTDLARSQVDVWFEASHAWYTACEAAGQVSLLLQDFSSLDSAATPYSSARAEELNKLHANLKGHTAVIVSKQFYATITELLIRTMHGNVERRIFMSKEQGLNWLREWL